MEVEEVDLRLDLEAAAGAWTTLITYCLHNHADVHINCSTLQVMMRIQRELFDTIISLKCSCTGTREEPPR